MTLWARADVQSISVPVTSGGCGQTHNRGTDLQGYPNVEFELNCPGCEHFLKGGGRTELRVTVPGDPDLKIAPVRERVADIDPLWAASPDELPDTRTEQLRQAKLKGKVLGNHTRALTDGLSRLLNSDSSGRALTASLGHESGVLLCSESHANPPGNRFCSQCGKRLTMPIAA